MQNFIKIHDNDNVIVALNTLPAGTKIYCDGCKIAIFKLLYSLHILKCLFSSKEELPLLNYLLSVDISMIGSKK